MEILAFVPMSGWCILPSSYNDSIVFFLSLLLLLPIRKTDALYTSYTTILDITIDSK